MQLQDFYPIVVTEQLVGCRDFYQRWFGLEVALSLRDEPFGQRRFGLLDPAGIWIDVVEQIEPAAGWWDKYLVADNEA